MLDIDQVAPVGAPQLHQRPTGLEPLAKAHPASSLLSPGWQCKACGHRNPVTEPFCEKCNK